MPTTKSSLRPSESLSPDAERHRAEKAALWSYRNRQWRLRHPESARERARRHYRRHRERLLAQTQAWKAKYPERVKAHTAVRIALMQGKLVKPDGCSACGRARLPRQLEGHHEDYSKPLEVTWLCRKCHLKLREVPLSAAPAVG